MNIQVKITDRQTVSELDFYWQKQDLINLLQELNYPDADRINPNEVLDYLLLAITDFEPANAAEILLKYKLSDQLNDGQIQNISNEMLLDKIAEEYPEPALHYDLFNINQLLRKAYNGKFPNTEASIITLNLQADTEFVLSKEILLKALRNGLKENNLVLRLFADQLDGSVAFEDAEKVIWHYRTTAENVVEIFTSKYWIDRDDFEKLEYETEINFFIEE